MCREQISERAAPTARRRRVQRGRMLADDTMQDTQTAVPQPAADTLPTARSRTSSEGLYTGRFVGGIAGRRLTCFHGISTISRRIEI